MAEAAALPNAKYIRAEFPNDGSAYTIQMSGNALSSKTLSTVDSEGNVASAVFGGSIREIDGKYYVYDPSNPNDMSRENNLLDEDKEIIGTTIPKWFGGFNNTFTYKNWDLNVFVNGSFGAQRLNLVRFTMASMVGDSRFVTLREAYFNGFDKVGQGAEYPSLTGSGNNYQAVSTKWMENADYVRLENISLSYTFPRSMTKFADMYALGVRQFGIFVDDISNSEAVRFYAQWADTVVLARELSLEQIREIARRTTVPLEVFVHGALCVSYSGQCYLSAALGGRSANRGECAQYCRLPYTLVDADGREIAAGKHLLSLKDMNRGDYLEDLLDAGVSSLKIEGRLKEVSYVKNVTAWYRRRLDAILARRPEYRKASAGHCDYTFEPAAEKSFNRGFTPFFLRGRSRDITSFDTPKSAGEPVGTVKDVRGNSFSLQGTTTLRNGDGLTFFNERGTLEGFRVNRVEADRVFTLERPALRPGTRLYRNHDQAFERLLEKPSAERRLSLQMEFTDNAFGFTLCLTDETGARVMLAKPFPKETARVEQTGNIRTQLSKLGGTPFEATEIDVRLSGRWFVPSSLLAEMRREGIERLLAVRRVRYRRELARVDRTSTLPYPERTLTYLGNVSNSLAEAFYRQHGVERVEKAFELSPRTGVPLMFTKHCLRYSMGWCPVHQKGQSPYKEPYYLRYKDTLLRLRFRCDECRMEISVCAGPATK